MKVYINDVALELANNTSLLDALKLRGIATDGIAVAINGAVLPRNAYPETILTDGDKLLIIKAFYGG